MPKDAPDRAVRVQAANKNAAMAPHRLIEICRTIEAVSDELGPIANQNLASDLRTAQTLCVAAREGLWAAVEANCVSIKDKEFVRSLEMDVGLKSKQAP